METRHTILLELQDIAPTIASIGNVMPYATPEGYFTTLPGTILSGIDNAAITNYGKENLLSAPPSGYFDSLPATILQKIQSGDAQQHPSEELLAVAPLLNSIDKAMPYSLPENYFANLTVPMPGKLRSMPGRAIKKWFNLAAAAVISIVLVTGVVKYGGVGNRALDMDKIEKEVAKSSDDEIIEYLDQHPTATGYTTTNMSSTDNSNEVFEGEGLFDGMSDNEIKDYLKDHSESVGKNVKDI